MVERGGGLVGDLQVYGRGWCEGMGAIEIRGYLPLLVGRPAARASSSACSLAAYAASSSTLELECPPAPPEV